MEIVCGVHFFALNSFRKSSGASSFTKILLSKSIPLLSAGFEIEDVLQLPVDRGEAVEFDRVLDHYTQADVLVLTSETEGWPKVIAEGMAFGLVCIGSARGLVPQMLEHGRGIVIDPHDVKTLAGTIRQIAEAPESDVSVGHLGEHGALEGQGGDARPLEQAQDPKQLRAPVLPELKRSAALPPLSSRAPLRRQL